MNLRYRTYLQLLVRNLLKHKTIPIHSSSSVSSMLSIIVVIQAFSYACLNHIKIYLWNAYACV